jgi:plastocyanin
MLHLRPTGSLLCFAILSAALSGPASLQAQDSDSPARSEVHLHLTWPHTQKHDAPPAVAWLEAMPGTPAEPFVPHDHYTLLQKNRAFTPHLLVVPVGGVVQFPNEDPFFHNVFSLFDGKRFDLGLYEAGSSKSVNFSREGVAYIFCNIHPEMSAVVIALSTPLYSIADRDSAFTFASVPSGNYRLHVWIEGIPAASLDGMTRPVHLVSGRQDLGPLHLPPTSLSVKTHANEYGKPYTPTTTDPY